MPWKNEAERALGESIVAAEAVAGGAFKVESRSHKFFLVKTAPAGASAFHAEAEGLEALSASVKTPKVHCASPKLLVIDWIESETPSKGYWRALGESLADLHSANSEHFGFANDNFIGMTPQPNRLISIREVSWGEFFIENRLKVMLHNRALAPDALLQATFMKCEPTIRRALEGVKEKPSLVHGDLWNGNVLCGPSQIPYFIDPAVYYGHREVDLAMSELFGGFDTEFYSAYKKRLPLAPGYESRRGIYNLYHLLNHWILFGESYRGQVMETFSRLA